MAPHNAPSKEKRRQTQKKKDPLLRCNLGHAGGKPQGFPTPPSAGCGKAKNLQEEETEEPKGNPSHCNKPHAEGANTHVGSNRDQASPQLNSSPAPGSSMAGPGAERSSKPPASGEKAESTGKAGKKGACWHDPKASAGGTDSNASTTNPEGAVPEAARVSAPRKPCPDSETLICLGAGSRWGSGKDEPQQEKDNRAWTKPKSRRLTPPSPGPYNQMGHLERQPTLHVAAT